MTDERAPRAQPRLSSRRTLAIAAVGIGTVSGMIGLLALREPAPPASRFAVATEDAVASASPAIDPLMAELLRCRTIPAGSEDAACQQAWEVNRRRFLGESRSYVPPRTATPSPVPPAPMAER